MFLDEPTTGLDPRSRNQVWDIVRALVGQGTTVLLCTQYLDEADQLADRIAVIDHGRVIAEGTPAQLKASVGRGALHVRLLDPDQRPRPRARAARRRRRTCEPDPAALSRRRAPAPTQASEAIAALVARRHRRRRLLARPAEPRRGLPRPHGPPRRGERARRSPHERHRDRPAPSASPELAQVHAALVARRAPAARRARVAAVPDLRLARHAQDQARPRAADRRDAHAGAVPADVHVPVRRRGRGLDRRLPAVPAARHARAVGAVHRPSTRASRSTRT